MKRTAAVIIFVTLVLSVITAAFLRRPVKEFEPAFPTTETGPSTSGTTEKPDDRYKSGPRSTEAADYGDSKIADICELMKKVTGMRAHPAFAQVEDFFATGFYDSSMSYQVSYQEYKTGEPIYTYSNYMQVSAENLAFNEFNFIANEEYGNVYQVQFINSNSKTDKSFKSSPFSKAEMTDYYLLLEKELTGCFGNPTSSKPLDKENQWRAYSEYKVDDECTFRVEFWSSHGSEKVELTCSNSVERKHILIHENKDDYDFDKENYHKPAGEGDIVTDHETGFVYVKNQLLVSFKLGTPNDMEKMNAICREIGAKVVGYLKETSDFQIEFDRDMTCEELLKIAKDLEEKYYYISNASLNYATQGDILD